MYPHASSATTASSTPVLSDRSSVTDAVRAQILATEHWSLLATPSMTWSEIISRTSMFITALSAAVVALALVAQATAFGSAFYTFALLTLPVVLLVGLATLIRLSDANGEDFGLVSGMNRLRHAYLELAPELEPYFVTEHYDDEASVMASYGLGARLRLSRILAGTPNIVAAINIGVFGVFAALAAQTLGATDQVALLVGVLAALALTVGLGLLVYHSIASTRRAYHSHFPR